MAPRVEAKAQARGALAWRKRAQAWGRARARGGGQAGGRDPRGHEPTQTRTGAGARVGWARAGSHRSGPVGGWGPAREESGVFFFFFNLFLKFFFSSHIGEKDLNFFF